MDEVDDISKKKENQEIRKKKYFLTRLAMTEICAVNAIILKDRQASIIMSKVLQH